MEVLIASSLTVLVVIGIGRLDLTRFYVVEELRQRSLASSRRYQEEVALAMVNLSKHLERADRLNLVNTGIPGASPFTGLPGGANLQLRIPVCPAAPATPACYDTATSYRWDQYVRNGNELRYYEGTDTAGCTNLRILSSQVSSFTLAFSDTSPIVPPGGEPFPTPPAPADNNIVAYALFWDDGAVPTPLTHEFRSQVAARGIAYSDVATGCAGPPGPCDSGTGLAPAGVSNPPLLCP